MQEHVFHVKTRYTFHDVWNAAKYGRNFNYVFWLHVTLDILFEHGMHFGGMLLISFAAAIITFVSFIGFFIVIPAVATPWTLWYTFNVLIG